MYINQRFMVTCKKLNLKIFRVSYQELVIFNLCRTKSNRSQMFFKVVIVKSFTIFTGKHLCWNLFLEIFRLATLLKRDSNIGFFLWILWNFWEQLYYRTPPVAASDCRRDPEHEHLIKVSIHGNATKRLY